MSKSSFKKLLNKLDNIDKDFTKLKADFLKIGKNLKSFKKELSKEITNLDKKGESNKKGKVNHDPQFTEPILINIHNDVKILFGITEEEITFSNFNKKVNKYLVDNNLLDKERKLIILNDELSGVLKFTRKNTKSKLNYNTVHNFLKHNYSIKKT